MDFVLVLYIKKILWAQKLRDPVVSPSLNGLWAGPDY